MNKREFKNILNKMIPSSNGLPVCSKIINTNKLLKKFNKKYPIKLEEIEKKLGNELVESYFTSKKFLDTLKMRKKLSFENKKKENLYSLLKIVRYKKKYFEKKFKNA